MGQQVPGIDSLKALFIILENKILFSRMMNYDDPKILKEHGFKSWDEVAKLGYACAQMRPQGQGVEIRHTEPLETWKWALRHQPHELPDWLQIGEAKAACRKLLPEWASFHHVRQRRATCVDGQALAVLQGGTVDQEAGHVWAYQNGKVIQKMYGTMHSFEKSSAQVRSQGGNTVHDEATVELYPGGKVSAYDNATVILKIDESRLPLGSVACYSRNVQVFKQRENGSLEKMQVTVLPIPKNRESNAPFLRAVL